MNRCLIAVFAVATFLAMTWVAGAESSMPRPGFRRLNPGHTAADRPNVLFLFSDDQRFDTIHALGNDDIKTPNLDRLVQNGFTFTHTYCMGSMQGAVCVPSRAMLLSGRTLFRVPANLPKDVPLWPDVMRQAGYVDFGTGKWHNGPPSYARAFQRGGPVFFGGMTNHFKIPVHDFDPTGKYDKMNQRIGETFSSELFADAAIQFLRSRKGDKPFFLYVAFTAPHDPRTPPGEFARMYDPEKIPLPKSFLPVHPFNNGEMKVRDETLAPWPRTERIIKQHIADYYGMISHLDAQVGRILKTLEETGHADNTIVIFAADNGLAVGRHGLLGKQNLYEHSTRVPLVFTGPGIPKGRKSDAFCYLFDILPTVCELTGARLPDMVEGQSLVPIMKGKRTKARDSVFGAYRDVQRSVRTERWKLIRYPHINTTQLFDLQNDPDELHNLTDDPKHAGCVQELTTLLMDWQKKLGDKQPLSTDKPAPLQIDLTTEPSKERK